MFDPDAFGAAMGDLIREAVQPLHEKIEDLEKQLAERPDVAAEVRAAVQALPLPVNGKDADMDEVRAFIAEQVAAIPTPENGKSVTAEDVAPLIAAEVAKLPPAEPGKSITVDDVAPMLEKAVQSMRDSAEKAVSDAIATIPVVKDGEPGKSVTVEDVEPVLKVAVASWALEFERRAQDTIQRALDKIVQPKDGEPGRDGLGFDDLAVEYDGEKTITLKMQRGDVVKEANIVMPINIDRGIFKEGQSYTPGDSVTWGGSYWIAQRDTGAKPDSPDSGWRLAVKKGRDGKNGRNGIDKTSGVKL